MGPAGFANYVVSAAAQGERCRQAKVFLSETAMAEPPRVLLLEDDDLLRDGVLVPRMRQFGFEVAAIGYAAELDTAVGRLQPHILVLDVGLPDSDGFEVVRKLRAGLSEIGIVMLTGRGDADCVRGLMEGADAYLSKPVEMDVLAATLHSLARRLRARSSSALCSSWRLDADGWCLVAPNGGTAALTKTEKGLLEILVESPNRVVTREALIARITTDIYDFDPHRLDSLIHRLRAKVSHVMGQALPLNSVRGEGYVLMMT